MEKYLDKKCYFIGILNLLGGTKMKKNLFAKTLKTVAEKGVKIGINRKCVAVYHEIDAPEKAKKFRMIIPGISEPPARTLRATVPENERHIFR